jgi:hypothetical protein
LAPLLLTPSNSQALSIGLTLRDGMQDAKAARTEQIGNNDRQLDTHLFEQALDLPVKTHAIAD